MNGWCGISTDTMLFQHHHHNLLIQALHALNMAGSVVPESDFIVTSSGIVARIKTTDNLIPAQGSFVIGGLSRRSVSDREGEAERQSL